MEMIVVGRLIYRARAFFSCIIRMLASLSSPYGTLHMDLI
jgi:hypothetical protein